MQNGKRGAFVIASTGDPTIDGGWNNQQLLKDFGLVPYLLHKNHGFHSVMVGLQLADDYPYVKKYLRGLELDFLPEDTLKARTDYIDAHAAEIDLLILCGAYPAYMPLVEHYKQIRPDGKIYLATNMNIAWADRFPHENSQYKKFLQACDVVAASCRATQKYLSAKWSVPVDLIRSGWYNFYNVNFNHVFNRKENVILTVGQIGANQKHHIMLEAFAKVADELPNWKLKLVGNVEENFKPYVEKFFATRLELKDRVIFTGLIEDKVALMNEYKRAKIFCLTSNFENGTPNVIIEALFSGDFIVCSAIDAADDITDDENCGKIFPIGDSDALAKIFSEVCRDDKLIGDGGRHAFEYAREQFDMNKIVARLNYLLYGGDGT